MKDSFPEIDASVVLCTRNRAAVLPHALETLAGQVTDRSFEVVVVDNASDDATPAVIDAWCRQDARFRTIREPRLGLSRAKNAGVRAARAPLVLFTDDDVLVAPMWVDALVALFRGRAGLVIAGGPIVPVAHDLGPWPAWLADDALVDLPLLDHGPRPRPLGKWEQLWGANMAVPKSVFERVGPWDERLGRKGDARGTWEDLEFADRVRRAGGEVWFCPDAVVQHRIGEASARPPRILRAAFRRGLRDHLNAVWASDEPAGARITPIGRLVALGALVGHLAAWISWAAAFHLVRSRAVFARARRRAWSAGWWMMELTLRRTPGSREPVEPPALFDSTNVTSRAAMQLSFLARRVALRLARIP